MLEILTYPDARLKELSEPVENFDAELREFVDHLEATMAAGPGAVGIAAPQVGRPQQVVIIDVPAKGKVESHGHLVLINPEITQWQGLVTGREGCLSVPDYTGNVVRAEKIQLKALDLNGRLQQFEMQGFEARVVQHELDHLEGLLFLDRLVSRRSDLFRRKVYKR